MYSDFSAWEWGMGIKGPLHYDAALDAAAAAADSLFLTPPNEAQRAMRVQGRRGGWVNEKCEKLHTKRSEMRAGQASAKMCPTSDLVCRE